MVKWRWKCIVRCKWNECHERSDSIWAKSKDFLGEILKTKLPLKIIPAVSPHQSLIRTFCYFMATFSPRWVIIDGPNFSRNTLKCNKIFECSWFDQIDWFLIYNTSTQYQFVILWQVLQMGLSNIDWSFWSFLAIWPFLTKSFDWCALPYGPSTRFLAKTGHLAKLNYPKIQFLSFERTQLLSECLYGEYEKNHAWIYELLVL